LGGNTISNPLTQAQKNRRVLHLLQVRGLYSEFIAFVYEVELKEYLENNPNAIAIHGVVGVTNLTDETLWKSSDKRLRRFILHCELESVLVGLPKRSGLHLEPGTEVIIVGTPVAPKGFKAYVALVPSVHQVVSIPKQKECLPYFLLSLLLFWLLKQIPFDVYMPVIDMGLIEYTAVGTLFLGFASMVGLFYWRVWRVPHPIVCDSASWALFQELIADRFSYVDPEMRELIKSVNAQRGEEE
jgi:hypothetical protein